ncbi:PTS system mannose-specific EIIAB component [Clostridium chromiireducens]|uniref:PTS system mannose-specific EIIAB component n=2 Tax=Clostridium chromiireducens TaxID=225345 RepID=A0A1V4I840_9CLOT|nr:PTS system mannose-specific EIIAB component [Clostridium chromiireducens]
MVIAKYMSIETIYVARKDDEIMISVIVGTHGMFSEEILKSAEMIFGGQENVASVTFKPGEGVDNLVEKYNKVINELDSKDGVLFMVDLFGGSPFNAASIIAMKHENMEIVTGVNLPMILEVLGSRDFSSLSELLEIANNSGKDAIKVLNKNLEEDLEDELV